MADTRRSLATLQSLFADNTSGDVSPQDGRDELISSHPEKTCQSAASASEPASAQLTGDLFLPSDGVALRRYSGSAWVPWGPVFPLSDPTTQTWAWVNQGSAAVTSGKGVEHVSCATNGGAYGYRVRKKSAPSTPYTVTALLGVQWDWSGANFARGGLVFRESATGKLIGLHIEWNSSALKLLLEKMTDASTFSATYLSQAGIGPIAGPYCFMRMKDDGTNLSWYLSNDGQNFVQVDQNRARGNFFTTAPDEVGFAVNPYSALTTVSLLSWKEA